MTDDEQETTNDVEIELIKLDRQAKVIVNSKDLTTKETITEAKRLFADVYSTGD